MFKSRMWIFLVCGFLLGAIGAQAQTQKQPPFLRPTASLYGSTGYWKTLTPDSLPSGQASFSVWYDRINPNPGHLTVSTVGVGGAVGLTDWLEFGANFEINRRVLVRRANQLSFGQQQLGFFGNNTPGSPPLPSELMPGSSMMPQLRFPPSPLGNLTGAAGYYNLLPFASRIQGNGVGTVTLGLKLSIFSEEMGAPVGFGVHTYATIPTHRSAAYLLSSPTQTGDVQLGSDLLLSKNVKNIADLVWNAGFRRIQSPDNGKIVELSDVVPLGFAINFPRNARLQFVEEVTANLFVGARTSNTSFGAEDPVEMTMGFRAFLTRYIGLSAGYRRNINQSGGTKTGFVVNLSYNYGPPLLEVASTPPSLTCTADPSEVLAGEMVRLSAQGVSSSGAALTYEWSTTGGTIDGSGPVVQLRTANLAPGTYTATVRATERPGLSSDCSTRVTVRQPPPPPPQPQPPTVTCSVDRPRVQVGEIVNLTARASSPQGRPLTYQWSSTGGQVEGSGANTRLDSTGLRPGNYTVRVRVTDDANQSAECSMQFAVEAPPPPPPPPQVSKLDECLFRLNSARVDNVCKAKLDNVALRLQSEQDATLALVGFAETTERRAQQLAQTRANNVRAYLRQKGIAEGRLNVRTGTGARGREYRRVDLHLVPRGATFTGFTVFPGLREAPQRAANRSLQPRPSPIGVVAGAGSKKARTSGTGTTTKAVLRSPSPGRVILARTR